MSACDLSCCSISITACHLAQCASDSLRCRANALSIPEIPSALIDQEGATDKSLSFKPFIACRHPRPRNTPRLSFLGRPYLPASDARTWFCQLVLSKSWAYPPCYGRYGRLACVHVRLSHALQLQPCSSPDVRLPAHSLGGRVPGMRGLSVGHDGLTADGRAHATATIRTVCGRSQSSRIMHPSHASARRTTLAPY